MRTLKVWELLLTEGGNAFDDVVPISIADFKQTWIEIVDSLRSLGLKNITAIGSTGKKAMMGDLDVAAENNFTRDEVFVEAQKKFGAESVKKVGSNIVTIRFPVYNFQEPTGEHVQVDVMLGDTKYLSWARAGTSPEKGHPDFSPVKGVVRNVLLNVINRFMAQKLFPGEQSELDRVRYSVDFDKGLFKTTQTKRNKTPGGSPTKTWKTVKSELISSNPDKIVEVMFGKGFKASDLRRFEDVVDALCDSPNTSDIADEVLNSFVIEMRDLVAKNPHFLGDDPEVSLLHIEQIALGE